MLRARDAWICRTAALRARSSNSAGITTDGTTGIPPTDAPDSAVDGAANRDPRDGMELQLGPAGRSAAAHGATTARGCCWSATRWSAAAVWTAVITGGRGFLLVVLPSSMVTTGALRALQMRAYGTGDFRDGVYGTGDGVHVFVGQMYWTHAAWTLLIETRFLRHTRPMAHYESRMLAGAGALLLFFQWVQSLTSRYSAFNAMHTPLYFVLFGGGVASIMAVRSGIRPADWGSMNLVAISSIVVLLLFHDPSQTGATKQMHLFTGAATAAAIAFKAAGRQLEYVLASLTGGLIFGLAPYAIVWFKPHTHDPYLPPSPLALAISAAALATCVLAASFSVAWLATILAAGGGPPGSAAGRTRGGLTRTRAEGDDARTPTASYAIVPCQEQEEGGLLL